jgi:hypothetical protein
VSETDKRLRERLIASGQLRPNTKELDPIQLNPGAVVLRIDPGLWRFNPWLEPMEWLS